MNASTFYQTSHLSRGFIFDPSGQLNSLANSGRLESDPMTRKFGGLCGSFSICKFIVSSVMDEHHTYNRVFFLIFKKKLKVRE